MTEETEETFSEAEASAIVETATKVFSGLEGAWGPSTVVYYGPGSRSILLAGEVNQELANSICSQVHQLHKMGEEEPITVYINTPGGSVTDALAIYDILRCVKCPIITIANGGCFSAGLLILSAGDLRLATTNSTFFYHQSVMESAEILSKEIAISTIDMYKWTQETMDRIIRERCGMDQALYDKHFSNKLHKHFDAATALKYNIIDEILEPAEKPGITLVKEEE